MNEPWIGSAVGWLKSVQKPDKRFGESCATYDDPSLKGKGESTASQTAWGAMAMMAAVGASVPCVGRAIQWLFDLQAYCGWWYETWLLVTGIPLVLCAIS